MDPNLNPAEGEGAQAASETIVLGRVAGLTWGQQGRELGGQWPEPQQLPGSGAAQRRPGGDQAFRGTGRGAEEPQVGQRGEGCRGTCYRSPESPVKWRG